MTANLVVQVSMEPKLVGVALERESVTAGLVTRRWGLHLVAPRPHRPRRGAPVRQAGQRWSAAPDGAVLALSGQAVAEVGPDRAPGPGLAAGYLDCRLTGADALGSHVFCIGEVTEVGGEPAEAGVLRMEDTRMHYGG